MGIVFVDDASRIYDSPDEIGKNTNSKTAPFAGKTPYECYDLLKDIVTKTKSEVAAYAFTTLTAIPGVLEYGGAEIQILDLPGIIEGAAEGKGRGRQVISAAKTSDMILMVLDATKKAEQRRLLEQELEAVGIRLNREPP